MSSPDAYDQPGISAGYTEVEASKIAVHGQFRHIHLMMYRAHCPVGVFLIEEMLDQPFR